MLGIAESLERDGALTVDLTTATDILWTLNHPDVYQLLVKQRGWSPERYEQWLVAALCGQLLVAGGGEEYTSRDGLPTLSPPNRRT